VYGPESNYDFSWRAEFTDNSTVVIYTTFQTSLKGNNKEEVIVEFMNSETFVGHYSRRSVNIENQLTAYLNKQEASETTKSLGRMAMILFLSSVVFAAISSFGGNSMEMMWNLMNTLQLMYFLSFVNVNFPPEVDNMFEYFSYANANNEYMSAFAFVLIPEEKFERGEVNEKLGDKAFYVN
jgi:hypothetical protein